MADSATIAVWEDFMRDFFRCAIGIAFFFDLDEPSVLSETTGIEEQRNTMSST